MFARCKRFSYLVKIGTVFSLALGLIPIAEASPFLVNVLAGGSAIAIGHEHDIHFPAGSFRTDTFESNNYPIGFVTGLGVAYDFMVHNNVLHDVSLGVNGYDTGNSLNGSVLEYGLSDFYNSTYKMHIQSTRFMVDTELNFSEVHDFIPFVQAGIGTAVNTMQFKNIPIANIGADGGNYSLPDHSQTQFAYELGVGFKVALNEHAMLSARYLYANAGDAKSSTYDPNTGVLLGKPITVNVDSQSILFGVSLM